MNFNTELKDFLAARYAMSRANYYDEYGDRHGGGPKNDPKTDRPGWYRNTPDGRKYVDQYRRDNNGALPPDYEPSLLEWGVNKIRGMPGGVTTGTTATGQPAAPSGPGVIPGLPGTSAPGPTTDFASAAMGPDNNAKGGVVRYAGGGVIRFEDGQVVPGITPPSATTPDMMDTVLQQLNAEYNQGSVAPPASTAPTSPRAPVAPQGPGGATTPPPQQRVAQYDPAKEMGVIAQDPRTGQAVRLDKSTIEQALAGGAKFANDVFNLKSRGVLPGQQHPEAQEGSKAILNRVGAEDPQNVSQLDRIMGRDAKDFREDLWSMKRLHYMYRYYNSIGDMDKANKVAYELMQASSELAGTYGTRGLQALQGGNVDGAIDNVVNGLNAVPDGKRYQYDRKSARIEVFDSKTGQKLGETYPVNGQQIYRAAMGLQTDLPWQMMHARVEAAFKDKSQTRTPAQEELTRANIDLTKARTRAVNQKLAGGAPTGPSPLAKSITDRLSPRHRPVTQQPAGTGAPAGQLDPAMVDALYGTPVTEAEGGMVPGYAGGGDVVPLPPYQGTEAGAPPMPPTSYATSPLQVGQDQPPPGAGVTIKGTLGSEEPPAYSMIFHHGPGGDDPDYNPDFLPNRRIDRQGDLLLDLPTTPTPDKFNEPHPWSDADREHRDELQRILEKEVPNLAKGERTAIEKAVKAEIADMDKEDKEWKARKKDFETKAAHTAEADLSRKHAEARQRISADKLSPYTAEKLGSYRGQVGGIEDSFLRDSDMPNDVVNNSVFRDNSMKPAGRQEAILDILAKNNFPGNNIDPQKAVKILYHLTGAGDYHNERNYKLHGIDANGNVIVEVRDTGDIVHLDKNVMANIARVAQTRTNAAIERNSKTAQEHRTTNKILGVDIKNLQDAAGNLVPKEGQGLVKPEATRKVEKAVGEAFKPKKFEDVIKPLDTEQYKPDDETILRQQPQTGPRYGQPPPFRER